MRFVEKKKNYPKHGDTRIVRRFTFFPKKLDGIISWLQMENILQIYVCDLEILETFLKYDFDIIGWNDVRFVCDPEKEKWLDTLKKEKNEV